jgi:formylglycine-generating enzyme required for sulfatase activity
MREKKVSLRGILAPKQSHNYKILLGIASLSLAMTIVILFSLFLFRRNVDEVSAISIDESDEMVEIPSGLFTMGSSDGEFDERPLHKVEMESFYMDRYEVTNLQYQKFILANPHYQKGKVKFEDADYNYLNDWIGNEFPKGKENHPTVYISWHAANAYAKWAKKSLPTEAQFEYAARGGYEGMMYVWGNSWEPHLSNFRGKGIMPVGSFSMNGFGVNDMAGNVWEWTSDGYELYLEGEEKNPRPRLNNHQKVIRGGSWGSNKNEMRVSVRRTEKPNVCRGDLGFRCIKKQAISDEQ